jgi:uncharacterized protein involved in exopolysaccharide biosynthesis
MTSPEHSPKTPDAREQFERALTFLKRSTHFWWVVPVTMVVGAVLAGIVLLVRQPDFMSETVVLYSEGVRPPDPNGQTAPNPRNNAVRLKELLLARHRLDKIIHEFNLYQDEIAERGMVGAIDEFREDIIFKAPGSDTFTIGYKGKSPEQAKRVTERLAQSVMEEEGSLRRQQALLAREFLDKERKRAEEELKKREHGLAEFLAKNPGFALDSAIMAGANSSGAAIRAAQTQSRASAASAAGGGYVTRVVPGVPAAAAAGGASAPVIVGPDPQLAAKRQAAEAALNAARANLAEQMARYTEQHPNVRSAKANVARAEGQLLALQEAASARPAVAAAPVGGPAATAEAKPRTILVRRAAPKTERDKDAERTIEKDLVALETEWTRLTRDVQEARVRHDQLEGSFFKADIAASSESGGHGAQVHVVDPAFLPTKPVPPGRFTILAAVLAVALMLGLGLMAGLTAVDDRVYDARDAASFAPVLVEVPLVRTKARRVRHA